MTGTEVVFPILLVEDNQADIELTLYAFNKIHCSNPIEVCRNGAELFDKIKTWKDGAPLPLCVLLDINMPGVNGFEALARIKEEYPTIPVIMLTSSQESSDVKKAYALGVNSYIVKPVQLDNFIEIARQINLYWMVYNTSPQGEQ